MRRMIEEKYTPHAIESKWQKYWEDNKAFKTDIDAGKPKSYVLEMFPYPSGNLHMGHVRNYSIGDVVARFRSMNGFNVLHPMGWDSFGMPAENAAIKHGIHPAKWTMENIANMTRQQKELGLSYDWDREVATCKEDYYKWTQWFFELFYKRGLAVKKKSAVNWCGECNTVLANEQVIDGRCWRCDHEVVKKDLEQWFFKITDYAEELLDDLKLLNGWPERVKTMQKNWIGRSEGLEFSFDVPCINAKLPVYTTRPDTAFGVTFVVLAAEHPMVEQLCRDNPKADEIRAFCARVRNQSDIERTSSESEKEGIFTGKYAVNPFNGRQVEIWVTNYVLYDYGTGAVMGVPTGDQRDWMFADKYGLDKIVVVTPKDQELKVEDMTAAYEEKEGVLVNSGKFSGMEMHAAIKAILVPAMSTTVCATGSSAVSVIGGLRSRLFTVLTAAKFLCRKQSCRYVYRKTSSLMRAAFHRWQPVKALLTAPAPNAVSRPAARPILWTLSCVLPGIICGIPIRKTILLHSVKKLLITGLRSISTSGVSSMRSCICCIHVSL